MENYNFIYDGSCFNLLTDQHIIDRVSIEGIMPEEAAEIIFDTEGEDYSLIYDQIQNKNPEILNDAFLIYKIEVKKVNENYFIPAGLAIIKKDYFCPNSFHISEIAIKNEFQDLGLGSAFIQRLIEDAEILGFNCITLQCYEDDEEPIQNYNRRFDFYLRNGFIPIDTNQIKNLMCYFIRDISLC